MIDPREHLEIITRMVREITASLDAGEVPNICDGKVLARNARILEEEIARRFVASLREQHSAEADRLAQVAMAAQHNQRADNHENR